MKNTFPYALLNSQKCIPPCIVQGPLDLTPIPVVQDQVKLLISIENASKSSLLKTVQHMELFAQISYFLDSKILGERDSDRHTYFSVPTADVLVLGFIVLN